MASHIPSTSYASSFDNSFANEPSLVQRAAASKPKMSKVEFEQSLEKWVRDAGNSENRIPAKNHILKAYDKGATELNLAAIYRGGLSSLPECIGELINLKTLNLHGNKITILPKSIGQLRNLETLNLDGNRITILPESFGNLKRLQLLGLYHNQIITLPSSLEDFWKNRKLQHIETYDSESGPTPKTCQEKYGTVTYFDLTETQTAAQSISDPSTIKRRKIERELTEWAQDAGPSKRRLEPKGGLTRFRLPPDQHYDANFRSGYQPYHSRSSHQSLRDCILPEHRFKAKERILKAYDDNATELNLEELALSSLPECIGELTHLQTLNLFENQLTTLPKSIERLAHLQVLVLKQNRFTTLPEWFGSLIQIQKLYLERNPLKNLPVNFGNLKQLHTLWLTSNQITTLPENFSNLSNLQTLDLSDNKITTLPSSLKNFWENRVFRGNTCQKKYGTVTYFDPEPIPVAASTSASPHQYLRVTASQKENILSFTDQHAEQATKGKAPAYVPQSEQVLTLKVLPATLQLNKDCALFFGDYSQAMLQLYSEKTADAVGYSNTEASKWSRIASVLLGATGVPGLSVVGRLLTYLSKHHNESEAANQANSILAHFTTAHQFEYLTSHMAVRLTKALQGQLNVLLSQSTQKPLEKLKEQVKEWMQQCKLKPMQNLSPFALLTAMTCMKVLLKTPSANRQVQLGEYYITKLTDELVCQVLDLIKIDTPPVGPSTHNAAPKAVWTDVHEVPSPSSSTQAKQPTVAEIAKNLRRTEEIANTALLDMQQQLQSAQAGHQALQNTLTQELSRLQTELKNLKASHCSQEQVKQLERLITTVKAHAEEHQSNANQKMQQLTETTQELQTKKQEMEEKIRAIQSDVKHNNARSELLMNTQQLTLKNTHKHTITHMVGSSITSTSQPQPEIDIQFQQEIKIICRDFSEQITALDQGMNTSHAFIQGVEDHFNDLRALIQSSKEKMSQQLLRVRNQIKNQDKRRADTQQKLDNLHGTVEQQKAIQAQKEAELAAENAALKNKLEDIERRHQETEMMEITIKTIINAPRRLEAIATQYFQGLGLSFEHKQKQYLHYNTPSTFRKMIVGKKMEKISVSDLVRICLATPTNNAPKPLIKAMLNHLLRPSDIATANLNVAGNKQRLYEAVLQISPQ